MAWTGSHSNGFPTAFRRRYLAAHPECARCGAPATDVDHFTPRAEGGTDDPSNAQALCQPCHQAKTRTEIERGRARRSRRRPVEAHPGEVTHP
jgi:5-methylcytosine-specific restriction protein A